LILVCAASGSAMAYEQPTHDEIARVAIVQSTLADGVKISDLGIKPTQKFKASEGASRPAAGVGRLEGLDSGYPNTKAFPKKDSR